MNWNMLVITNLLLSLTMYSCNLNEKGDANKVNQIIKENGISIDSIYKKLSQGKKMNHVTVPGNFVYTKNDTARGEYIAQFISTSVAESIKYVSNSGGKKDKIIFGNKSLLLYNLLDPLSINIYEVSISSKKYLVFIGKSQAASGTGVQMSYFVLLELGKDRRVINFDEFESRFGNINSLIDHNNDTHLDYYKIVHGKEMDEYILTVRGVKNGEQVQNGQLLLKYLLNDKFEILENQLLTL